MLTSFTIKGARHVRALGLAGVAAAALAVAPGAMAQDFTPDLSVSIGTGFSSTDDLGEGTFYSAGVGLGLPLGFRTDITAIYQTGYEIENAGDADLDTYSAFVSAYYDLPDAIPFIEPYIGAGVGASYFDADGDTETLSSYHISAGLSFDVFDFIALDAGYRYLDYGDFENTNGPDLEATADQFTLTGRLTF